MRIQHGSSLHLVPVQAFPATMKRTALASTRGESALRLLLCSDGGIQIFVKTMTWAAVQADCSESDFCGLLTGKQYKQIFV